MAKIRVYELAKELDQDNKSLVKVIRGLGIPIKNQMSTLSPEEAERVRSEIGRGGTAPSPSVAPAARPAASSTSTPPGPRPVKRPPPPNNNESPAAVIRRRGAEVKRRRAEREEQQEAAAQVTARAIAEDTPRTPPPVVRPRPEAAPAPRPVPPAAPRVEQVERPMASMAERPTPPSRMVDPTPPPQPRAPVVATEPPAPSVPVARETYVQPQHRVPPQQPVAPPPAAADAPAAHLESEAPKVREQATRKPGPATLRPAAPQPEPEKRVPPAVGTRIELPKGSRRLPGGMASRMETPEPQPFERASSPSRQSEVQQQPQRRIGPASRGGPVERTMGQAGSPRVETRGEHRSESRVDRGEPRGERSDGPTVTAKPQSGAAAAPTGPAGRRVVRNEEGVIVGAASQRSQPKILGFIPLQRAQPKRQQVIITDASEEDRKGRASQRKQREERAQAQGRRRKNFKGKGPERGRGPSRANTAEMSEEKKRIRVDEAIQVSEIAHQMGQKASVVLRQLWSMGLRGLTINHAIDHDTAELVAAEFGYTVENVAFQEGEILESAETIVGEFRAPVVTIMGHVDHGKTSLLDHIRTTRVAAGEAGGITQHIGAYKVPTSRGEVVFLDTPGHEAFSAMRSRGAQITDIVVLVVAADDGVMPTTTEAIKHSREAKVPIVVAINKIDKPDANPGRVKQMLMEQGLVGEEFGGDTPIVHVSAKTGQGIEELLETLSLQAEVLELTAPIEGRARGVVLEARIDKGRGTVATVLIQAGTLRKGDILVANEFHGKVRGLFDAAGHQLEEAGPSTPVEVLGLSGVPAAGDAVNVVESDRDAKALVSHRREQRKRKESVRTGPTIQELLQRKKLPVLKIVLKADVQGSAQALAQALEDLSTEKVKVEILKAEVGQINETDVKFARAGDAVIFGFNVKTTGKAAPVAEAEDVTIHTFSIIYEATDRAKELMIGMLEPEYREREQGEAEVRALFPIPRLGVVAGCRVVRGIIQRSSHIRVVRNGAVLHQGTISSLRVHKDDVREVKDGFECGIVVDFPGIQEGDRIQAFDVEAIPPTL